VPMPAGANLWIFNTHTKHALVDGLYAARHRECMEAAAGLGVSALVDASEETLAANESKLSPIAARRARHIIGEIARVRATVEALQAGDLPRVGGLLTASHRSSQSLFENSTRELDFLVDQLAATSGVYGARVTGGGFGGAVMAFTSPEFGETQAAVVSKSYHEKYGAAPDVLRTQLGDGAEVI